MAATAKIAPTATTCQQFRDGSAGDLTDLFYNVKSQKVNNVCPGVFFYYSKVTAPSGAFTIEVTQSNDKGWGRIAIQDIGQVIMWNQNCTKTVPLTVTQDASGTVRIVVANGVANPGATYYLSIKYDPGSLVGQNVGTSPPAPTYVFITKMGPPMTPILTSWDSIKINPKP